MRNTHRYKSFEMKVIRVARDDTPEKHERSEEVNFPFDAKRTSGFPSPGRLEYIFSPAECIFPNISAAENCILRKKFSRVLRWIRERVNTQIEPFRVHVRSAQRE